MELQFIHQQEIFLNEVRARNAGYKPQAIMPVITLASPPHPAPATGNPSGSTGAAPGPSASTTTAPGRSGRQSPRPGTSGRQSPTAGPSTSAPGPYIHRVQQKKQKKK